MKILKIQTCYQCQFSSEASDVFYAWCHLAARGLGNMDIFPEWCPLPDEKEEENSGKPT
jgi:hypothetical protein